MSAMYAGRRTSGRIAVATSSPLCDLRIIMTISTRNL